MLPWKARQADPNQKLFAKFITLVDGLCTDMFSVVQQNLGGLGGNGKTQGILLVHEVVSGGNQYDLG